jgi:4Fe-4S ferredoxin
MNNKMMSMRLRKTENDDELVIERNLYTKNYALRLDKARCTGCGICEEICPKEAIETQQGSPAEDEKTPPPTVDIDETKCHFCGICDSLCPFGALELRIDGEPVIPVNETESFPKLVREIHVDSSMCELECVECEEACPLNLITVRVVTPDDEEVTDIQSWPDWKVRLSNLKVVIDVDREHCPCCRACELKCPPGAFRVRKIFLGTLRIDPDECPEGCHACVDVCPIEGTLSLTDDGSVHVNELTCVYCGACQLVCPEDAALTFHRTRVMHSPVRSGAWNKALEKLASTKEMSKELKMKGHIKTREAIKKRFAQRL